MAKISSYLDVSPLRLVFFAFSFGIFEKLASFKRNCGLTGYCTNTENCKSFL